MTSLFLLDTAAASPVAANADPVVSRLAAIYGFGSKGYLGFLAAMDGGARLIAIPLTVISKNQKLDADLAPRAQGRKSNRSIDVAGFCIPLRRGDRITP